MLPKCHLPKGGNLVKSPGCKFALNTLWDKMATNFLPTHFFKCISLNEIIWIPIKISLKFVPKGPISNYPSLVQIMAWHQSGDKPLFEPMMISLPTHICVTRTQWVKSSLPMLPSYWPSRVYAGSEKFNGVAHIKMIHIWISYLDTICDTL